MRTNAILIFVLDKFLLENDAYGIESDLFFTVRTYHVYVLLDVCVYVLIYCRTNVKKLIRKWNYICNNSTLIIFHLDHFINYE